MTTSAAVPGWLEAYARAAGEDDRLLAATAGRANTTVSGFLATRPEFGGGIADPTPAVRAYATRAIDVDAWVGRVAAAFRRADTGMLACRIPPRPVVIDDAALAGAGWPTREEAAAAGRAFAGEVAAALDGDVDHATLARWAAYVDLHRHDPHFTAAFFEGLGVEGTAAIPRLIEDAWPHDRYGDTRFGLDLLRPFSEALATALTVASDEFARRLADYRNPYDPYLPEDHHHALLFTAGTFPTGFLVRLADNHVTPALWWQRSRSPLHITPWGPAVDPVANVLGALGRNPAASLAYLDRPDMPRLFLERYGHDLDGDGGRAAATVLRAALLDDDTRRAEALFDRVTADLADLGELRNLFLAAPLGEAFARHVGHVADVASDERAEAHDALVALHDALALVLVDDDAARAVYDGALTHVHDTLAAAGEDDTLGSEMWRTGSLLGLLVAADTNARIEEAERRIARRQALVDGLRTVSDLVLAAVPGGRLVPFAKTGRDAILRSLAPDGDLDETLADVDHLEARIREELSVAAATRLVASGDLPPPRDGDLRDWLQSDAVRDAITGLRTQAGQRMDEVEDALPAAE